MTLRAYLDYNATTPVRPEAIDAVTRTLGLLGNASSVHGFGRQARQVAEDARAHLAALVGARPGEVVFTSGGSEANDLALNGFDLPVLASAGEHDSVLRAPERLRPIPLQADGRVDLAALRALLAETGPALVSVMAANNETGVLQPLAEIARLAHEAGGLFHCDGVQAAGKIPLDLGALGVDLLSLSAHKMGGPQGVGALIVGQHLAPRGFDLTPRHRGGGQEQRRRAGTENLPGIVGSGAAARMGPASLADQERLADLRDRLERDVSAMAPEVVIFGREAPRLANTSCFAVPGLRAETQVMAMDLAGVAVSAGSACSSGKVAPSHVLRAMGASDLMAQSAIRVSLGWQSVDGDVDRFLEAWRGFYQRSGAA